MRRDPTPSRLFRLAAAAVLSIAACASPADRLAEGTSDGVRGPAPTNGKIAFDMDGDIYLMKPDGTGVTNLTETRQVSESDPAWSPDGRQITYVACRECTTSDIYVMNVDGTDATRITDDAALDGAPTWAPDGDRIAYHSDSTGHWSEDEGWVPGNDDIWVVDADGTEKWQVTDGSDHELHPAWSPDGTRIAFHGAQGTSSSSIYVIGTDGSGRSRLTDPSLWIGSLFWSLDGSTIAFNVVDPATTTSDVYVMNADATGIRQLTDEPPAAVRAWSPDGRRVLFARLGSHHSLHTLELAGGAITDLYTAPRPQSEGVYIHGAAWQPVPLGSEPDDGSSPSPQSTDYDTAAATGFYPGTYGEGDRVIMPVTFVDGSAAEIVFPESLGLQDMRAQIFTAGGLGGVDRTIDFLYRDASSFKHQGPLGTYEGHDGRSVEVWKPAPRTYGCPNLVYRFGDWYVGVRTCQGELSDSQKGGWARSLIGRQTDDGFLVLDAVPPLVLEPTGGHEGPELILTGGDTHFIQFEPARCDPYDVPDDWDIRTMDDGTKVSFSRIEDGRSGIEDDWFATWCEDGLMRIQIDYSTRDFAEAAAAQLRVRDILLAENDGS